LDSVDLAYQFDGTEKIAERSVNYFDYTCVCLAYWLTGRLALASPILKTICSVHVQSFSRQNPQNTAVFLFVLLFQLYNILECMPFFLIDGQSGGVT